MLIKQYFKENLNDDIFQYIIDFIYKKNRTKFIKNCKKDLLNKVIQLCDKKLNFYRNDEEGDLGNNQTLYMRWNLYLYQDVQNKESKYIWRY